MAGVEIPPPQCPGHFINRVFRRSIMKPINEFMRSPVIEIEAQRTVEEAAKMMFEKKIGSLIVKEGDDHVGILTKSDIVSKVVARGKDSKGASVSSVMSKPILSKDQYVQRSEANEFMLRHRIKYLVVTQGKTIIGIITTKDLVS